MSETMTDTTHCPSCGILYSQHLGLIGTCRELQEAREAVEIVSRTSNEYMVQNTILREALERIVDVSTDFFATPDKWQIAWDEAQEALQRAGGGE